MRKQSITPVAAAIAIAGLAACDADHQPTGPRGGTVALRLETPHADDGALVVEARGLGAVEAHDVAGGLAGQVRVLGDSVVRAVVLGDVADGAVLRLRVTDVGAALGAQVRVVEVADRGDRLRESLAGYRVRVTPE